MQLPKVSKVAPPIDWTDLPKRYMNPGELEVLCYLVKSVNPKSMIEIGINRGRTAKAILREVPSIKLYVGVDVNPGYSFEKTVQSKEVPVIPGEMVIYDNRVKLLVSENGSFDLTEKDLPQCDAIFIDGDHSYKAVKHDTELALKVVKKGGIIIWHDYNHLQNKRGERLVDVARFLEDKLAEGMDIKHVKDTWIAYTVVK